MKITVELNGEKRVLDAEPSEKLLTVLRRERLYSVKCGCGRGLCGNCMVLEELPQDGGQTFRAVPSCTLPVSMARDCKIITLEYFQSSEPLYKKIISGFTANGVHLCGYCNTGKIFTAYGLLRRSPRPTAAQVYEAIGGLDCCCTDRDTLANAILAIIRNLYAD